MSMTTTEQLAHFITHLQYADLPEAVVLKAKQLTTDALGAQLAASTLPWSKSVYRFVQQQGGTQESTVVNYGMRTSTINAAFANCAFNHGFELDDNHGRTHVKGSSVTVGTTLAVGEQRHSSGKDFITALVIGYELMFRISMAIRPKAFERSHHPTGTIGAIGAAAITAKLHGMTHETTTHALGGAANNMSGFAEVSTSGRGHIKRIYGAMAATGGIRAALLAAEGMTGPKTTLNFGSGMFRSFEVDEETVNSLTEGLGEKWEILDVYHKVYAQDGFIQPMSEALELIREKHEFDVDDIDRIWVGTCKRAKNEVVGLVTHPTNLTDAQFCASFSVAQYLVTGGAGFNEYAEENLKDPRIIALSEKVVLEIDDEMESGYQRARLRGAKVVITMKSGEEFAEKIENLRPMTAQDLDTKFRALSQAVMDQEQSERLLNRLHRLEEVRDVSALLPLLTCK